MKVLDTITVRGKLDVAYAADASFKLRIEVTTLDLGGGNFYAGAVSMEDGTSAPLFLFGKSLFSASAAVLPYGTWDFTNATVTGISGLSDVAWGDITGTPTTLAGYGITDAQPLDADLTALAGLSGTGYVKRTGTDAWGTVSTIPLIDIIATVSSPSALAADTNNYSPTNFSTASLFRVGASTTARNITGISSTTDGRATLWTNVTSVPLILKDENGSSSAANRIASPADVILLPDDAVLMVYDNTTQRHRPVVAMPINIPRVLHQSVAQTLFQSTTAEQTLMSCTVPAHWMGPEGGIDFVVIGVLLNNHTASMTFTFRIKFGATTLWAEAITVPMHTVTHRPYELRGYLNNTTLTAQYLYSVLQIGDQGTGAGTGGVGKWPGTNLSFGAQVGCATSTADTKSDQTLSVTVQMSASGVNAQVYRTFSRAVLTRQV